MEIGKAKKKRMRTDHTVCSQNKILRPLAELILKQSFGIHEDHEDYGLGSGPVFLDRYYCGFSPFTVDAVL